MRKRVNVESTITIELSVHDIVNYITSNKLVPGDWEMFSVDVKGEGISKGATLTIKCTQVGHSIPVADKQ